MRLLKYPTSLIMGKNNYIESGVKISKNVIIGNNNKIHDGTVIYPNTTIGNNNIILNNNILGEHPVNSSETFVDKTFGGLTIGHNNFLHVNNLIFSGHSGKTRIENNNKLLGESHIGHDVHIHNNVNIYTRGMLCGYVKMLDYSGVGVSAVIHQKKIIGNYSFIGMNNTILKNIFPFFININHTYSQLNIHRLMQEPQLLVNLTVYKHILDEICVHYQNKTLDILLYKHILPNNIYDIINNYLSYE